MKILLLDGNPKAHHSPSAHDLRAMEAFLGGQQTLLWRDARSFDGAAVARDLLDQDALVIAFPLYVDGIPSHLLVFFEAMEKSLKEHQAAARVYVLCNAGFFEARQTRLALEMMKIWCEKSGLAWGKAIGIGAGGMALAAPIGSGPFAKLGKELQTLAGLVLAGQSDHDCFVEPDFPRFLYKTIAHFSWRSQARKNGLSGKALHRRHSYVPPARHTPAQAPSNP